MDLVHCRIGKIEGLEVLKKAKVRVFYNSLTVRCIVYREVHLEYFIIRGNFAYFK